MVLRIDGLATDDALDTAIGADDEGRALGTHVLAAVHALLDPSAEEFIEAHVGVGDQAEGQLVLRAEAHVALRRVTAHPDDLVASGAELAVAVTQATCLRRAARGIVLGVEVEDDLTPRVVREAYLLPCFVQA